MFLRKKSQKIGLNKFDSQQFNLALIETKIARAENKSVTIGKRLSAISLRLRVQKEGEWSEEDRSKWKREKEDWKI